MEGAEGDGPDGTLLVYSSSVGGVLCCGLCYMDVKGNE